MYSTGKITTTANNTKVVGTNTKWKDNNSLVSPEQIILIQIGATIYINSIASIQSDTEMTLSFPVPAAVKDAAYNILTTMVNSVSDAANKIVAMNNANVQFRDILNRWATETGTITVTLPDGTTQQLRTAKEMDKQLEGKFDKKGGVIDGAVTAQAVTLVRPNLKNHFNCYPPISDSADSLAYFQYNITGSPWFGKLEIPRIASNVTTKLMVVGDFGLFSDIGNASGLTITKAQYNAGFRGSVQMSPSESPYSSLFSGTVVITRTNDYSARRGFEMAYRVHGTDLCIGFSTSPSSGAENWKYGKVYTGFNTTKDANGNLKAASPIVKVFADHIELNDESEGVELKKLHEGIYQLKNVLGMHSDASWGGINGGITIPSGINQLPLVYVDYDVLVAGEQHPFNGEPVTADEHGDIVIYTSYRKHFDLPQNVQYARLKTYPEFTKSVNGEQVELENGEPVDIPNGHWIDVRVNMPSNSIYNQKQAEAEAHAKEEAEQVAREEAKRAAEEEERAGQEAISDNDK